MNKTTSNSDLKTSTQRRKMVAGCSVIRPTFSRSKLLPVVLAILAGLAAHRAVATVLSYNPPGSDAYGQQSGYGTWDQGAVWYNGSGFQDWVDGNIAQFGSYFSDQNAVVALDGNRAISGLQKYDYVGCYTVITGTSLSDTLTLEDGSIIIVNNQYFSLQGCVVAGTNIVLNGSGGFLELGNYNQSDTVTNMISGLTLTNGQSTTVLLDKSANVTAVSGNVTVNGGSLQFDSNNELGEDTAITVDGGVVCLNGTSQTLSSLTALSANPIRSTNAGCLTLNGTSGYALTYSGVETDTNVNFTLGSASAQSVWFDASNNGTARIAGTMTFGGGAKTFNVDDGTNAIDMQLTGSISQTATSSLVKTGNGILELDGTNTYTGATTVNEGTLVLTTPGYNIYSGGGIDINNGSTFRVTQTAGYGQYNFGGVTFTFDANGGGTIDTSSGLNFVCTGGNTFATSGGAEDAIIGASGINLNGNSLTFDVARGTGVSDMDVQTVLWNSGTVTKTGNGILVLDGTNTYTGATTVNGGTLVLNTPDHNVYGGGGIDINNGSTFRVTQTGGLGRYDFGGVTFTFDTNGDGTIDTSSGVNFVCTSSNTFATSGGAEDTIIGASGINLGGYSLTFDVARGTGVSDLNVQTVLWNSGTVTKTGNGILVLDGTNTYTGATTVNGGTLVLNTPGHNIYSGSGIDINNGSIFRVTQTTGYGEYDFGGVAFTFDTNGDGTIDTSSGVNFVCTSSNTFATSGGAEDAIIGASGINLNGYSLTFDVAGGNLDVQTHLWNTSGTVTKTGIGILELDATNTYTGATTVSEGTLLGGTGGSCSNSAVTLSAAAGETAELGVSITDNTEQWTISSLTVDNVGTNSGLQFNFEVPPGTTVAPLNVTGNATLTTIPEVTIVVSDVLPASSGNGYPLMTWGASGPATTNGMSLTLPLGAVGNLAVVGKTLYLQVTNSIASILSYSPLMSAGQNTGNWNQTNVWYSALGFRNWADDNIAVFGSYPGGSNATVYLDGNKTVAGLTKSDFINAYTMITGTSPSDTLTLENGSVITVNNQLLSCQACVLAGTNVTVDLTGYGAVFETGTNGDGDTVTNTLSGLTLTSDSSGTIRLDKAANVTAVSGNVMVDGGILQFDANNELGANTVLTVNGGTVSLGGTTQSLSCLTMDAPPTPIQSSGAVGNLILNATSGYALTCEGDAETTNVTYTLGSGSAQSVWFDATNNGTAIIEGNIIFGGGTKTFNIDDGLNAISMQLTGNITQTAASSLVKTGNGTLELDGNNSYSGSTTVSEGILLGGTGGSCSNSTVTLSAAAGEMAELGVSITDNTKQWTIPSLMVTNGGTTSGLWFNFEVSPGTTVAPLNVAGNVTLTTIPGVTIVASDGLPVSSGNGYPLITWGGSGPTTTIGMSLTLPSGAAGNLAIVGKTLYLQVTTGIVAGVPEAIYYVSPSGSDTNPGTISQPFQTLAKAQTVVRAINQGMTGNIIVYLRGGSYTLTNTLAFGPADSGNSGYHVIYEAYQSEQPVISGGKTITGWTLHDPTNNIWQASVSATDNFRQMYVDGIKATRAYGSAPAGYATNATGFSTTDTNLQNYGNITNLEIVSHEDNWLQERFPVANIIGTNITFQQPCWGVMSDTANYVTSIFGEVISYGSGNGNIVRMENAYEFMNANDPGFWYLNLYTHTLYYIPRPWENLANATVEVPIVEQLFSLSGTAANPVSNLEFVGLTFRLANWLQPSTGYGLPTDQANQLYLQPEPGTNWGIKAAVDCTGANNVLVSGCTFHQLGGDGVNLLVACHGDTVTNCLFYDTSASAVQAGRSVLADAAISPDSGSIVSNVTVADCEIHDIGSDYQEACGLYFGYVEDCTITQNEIFDVPYSGMSLGGWGWLNTVAPYVIGNQLIGNKIHDHMQALVDGGGIYVDGWETNGTISGNYIYNQHNLYTELYLDDGACNLMVTSNLCIVNGTVSGLYWAVYKGTNNILNGNFADTSSSWNYNTNSSDILTNTTVVTDGSWPAAAIAIASASGPMSITNSLSTSSGVFSNPEGGIWESSGNWSSSQIASGPGQTGNFSALTLTADATVTLDSPATIGNLIFGDEGAAYNWILDGDGLTLAGSSPPTITVSNQTTIIETAVAGTNGLSKDGSGTLVLNAGNTYTGPTTVNGGTLELNTTDYFVYSGGNIDINNGSEFRVTQTQPGGLGRYDFGGVTFTFDANGGGSIDTYSGVNFVCTSSNTFATSGGAEDTIIGASGISLGGYSLTFNVVRGTNVSDLDVQTHLWNTNGTVTKTGNGIVELDATNTYTGATTVNEGTLLGGTGGSCSNSAVTLSAAAGETAELGVSITGNTEQWTISSLTVDNVGTSSDLQFNFEVPPGTTVAPLNIVGNVTLTTIPGIVITGNNLPTSSGNGYPLMTWGGSGPTNISGMTLTLPLYAAGNLVIVDKTLYLQVTIGIPSILSYSPLGSAGQNTGNWNQTNVWYDGNTGLFTNWADGNIAQFGSYSGGSSATVYLDGNKTVAGLIKYDAINAYTVITGTSSSDTLTLENGSVITVNNQWLASQGCVLAGTNVTVDLTGSGAVFEIGSYGDGDTVTNTLSGLTFTSDSLGTIRLDKAANVTAVSGNVTVAGGNLQFDANNELGANTFLTVNGGIASLGGTTQSLSSLVVSNTASITLSINRAAGTNTYGNVTGITTASLGGTLTVTNLGGTFQNGDSFTLISAAHYTNNFTATNLPALSGGLSWNWNPTTGTLSVVESGGDDVVSVTSNIKTSVSGNVLTLSWPKSYFGWTLESQTNALNIGLSGTWHPVGGSSATNSVMVTIDPTRPAVFYRLKFP